MRNSRPICGSAHPGGKTVAPLVLLRHPAADEPLAELNEFRSPYLEAVLQLLPDVWAIYLYGSFARGDAGPQSDLDLAVLLPPGPGWVQTWHLATQLTVRLGREVDLVDLRKVGDVLRMQVLQDGLLLYNKAPGEVLAWEATAMTRYGHYQREISELVEDFLESGVGYAGTPP